MSRRKPAKRREIAEPRGTLEIAALLSSIAARQSDTVLQLIEMPISELWRQAQAKVEHHPLPAVPDEVALELFQAVNDPGISDAEYRTRARALLGPWAASAKRSQGSRAAKVRDRLTEDWRRLRSLLKLVIGLRPCGARGDAVVRALSGP